MSPRHDNILDGRMSPPAEDAVIRSSDRVGRERGLRSAVLAGDERAWQTWYDESFDGLRAYVWWRCAGLRDLADDVVQETWLTAVRRVRDFDPERGSFATWLCGIAANVLRNHLRRAVRRQSAPRPVAVPAAEPADAALERREQAERIARALAELPERYEAALRAKYLDDRSVAEIAAAWDETPKAVESLLTRARQAFRDAYLPRESNHDRHPGP
jgi:RNA polymerase sigma-70 factor (ECF subfamily)